MKGQAHALAGLGAAAVTMWALQSTGVAIGPAQFGIGAAAGIVGALAPDIDHPGSTVSKRFPRKLVVRALGVIAPVAALAYAAVKAGGAGAGTRLLADFRPVLAPAGLLLAAAAAIAGLSLAVRVMFGHRGATHSLLFAIAGGALVALGAAALGAPAWIGAGFSAGWLSHLALDATTPSGLKRLWWPFRA